MGEIARHFQEALDSDLDRAQSIMLRVSRHAAPVRRGVLRRGIREQRRGQRRIVVSTAPHAAPVEFGARGRSGRYYLREGVREGERFLRERGFR